jgi:uncharacterized membrane protein
MTRWFGAAAGLTLLTLAVSAYFHLVAFDQVPARIPYHFNLHGEADGWTSKQDVFRSFYLMPVIMAGVLLLTLALPWLSPKPFGVDRFRDVYGYLMMIVVALLGYLHFVCLLGGMQDRVPQDRLVIGGIFLFFALVGNVLGQVRRNFWVGVRTPWTLADERVWVQTHRVAAWLFTAAGLFGLLAVLVGVPLLWCFVGVLIAAMLPVLYSLILYKKLERAGKVQ